MKNKILISSIILIVLLLGLSAISATDTNTTTTTNTIEKQTPTTNTPTNTDYKEKQDITKEVVTTNKTLKTKTLKTTPVEKTVNNFTEIKKVFSEISQKSSSYEWIINLEPGNYSSEETISCGSYLKDITINGNNQTIDFIFSIYNYNLTFNDSILTKYIFAKNLTLHNCTVDSSINTNYIIIDDNCIIKENTLILNEGTIITTNKTNIINYYKTYKGNYTLNNITLSGSRSNYGNLTIINSILNTTLSNYGNLTIINCTMSDIYDDRNWGGPTGLLHNQGDNLIIINYN